MIIISIYIIAISIILVTYRIIKGPTVFDRILGVNIIGTKTIILLCLISYYDNKLHFLDIALGFTLLNFIGIIAILRYLIAVKIHNERKNN